MPGTVIQDLLFKVCSIKLLGAVVSTEDEIKVGETPRDQPIGS